MDKTTPQPPFHESQPSIHEFKQLLLPAHPSGHYICAMEDLYEIIDMMGAEDHLEVRFDLIHAALLMIAKRLE